MKIKVELDNGMTAELDDYDSGIRFVSAGECSEFTISIQNLDQLLPIMKQSSSMYRHECFDGEARARQKWPPVLPDAGDYPQPIAGGAPIEEPAPSWPPKLPAGGR